MINWKSVKDRYIVWGIIWLVLFTVVLSLLPVYTYVFIPGAIAFIIFLALLKDTMDFVLINKGKDSLFHPHFEHTPLLVIVLLYTLYSYGVTLDTAWIFLALAAFADIVIDVQQDMMCCKVGL